MFFPTNDAKDLLWTRPHTTHKLIQTLALHLDVDGTGGRHAEWNRSVRERRLSRGVTDVEHKNQYRGPQGKGGTTEPAVIRDGHKPRDTLSSGEEPEGLPEGAGGEMGTGVTGSEEDT